MGAAFRWYRQRYERGQITRLGIAKLPYPFAHDIGIDAVAQGNTGYRCARLQAFLNNLCFEGFWIRVSLAHGDPLTGVVSRNPRKFCRKRSQAKFPAAETIRHGLSRMFWLCKPGISANGVPVP